MDCARRAWVNLRWEHPELYLEPPDRGPRDHPLAISLNMCCVIPTCELEAEDWVNLSFFLEFEKDEAAVAYDRDASRDAGLAKVRKMVAKLCERRGGQREAPSALRLLIRVNEKNLTESVHFTFCVDHCWTDGVGTYSFAGRYFTLLARELSNPGEARRDWIGQNVSIICLRGGLES